MIKLKSLLEITLSNERNFWLTPAAKLSPTDDHLSMVTNVIAPEDFDIDRYGLTLNPNGSVAEDESIYNAAYKRHYVRVTIYNKKLWFTYGKYPPSNSQMRELKNFAIERGLVLMDGENEKVIELNENIENIPNEFEKRNNVSYRKKLTGDEFQIGKIYSAGDVHRYIVSQHGDEFEDEDRVVGTFKCMELNPKNIEESEYHVEWSEVEQLARSNRPFPPIVLNDRGWIIDGGHRVEAAKIRNDEKIKALVQI